MNNSRKPMFTKPASKYTDRGRMYELVKKRNKQFSLVCKQVKNIRKITAFYLALGKIYKKHFPDIYKPESRVDIILFADQVNFFYVSDIQKRFDMDQSEAFLKVQQLHHRNLIEKNSNRLPIQYHLSGKGKLLIRQMQKEIAAAIVELLKPEKKLY